MIMPNEVDNLNIGDYRFGFNGMEGDNEASGVGNSYTAEFWQYSPRLGRRWNRDPLVKAWESDYATFSNNPIYYVDPSGAQEDLPPATIINLPEVVITDVAPSARPGSTIGTIFAEAYKGVVTGVEIATVSSIAFLSTVSSNVLLLGTVRGNPAEFKRPDLVRAAEIGQTAGDVGSMLVGVGEIVLGAGGEVLGAALDVTGIGAIAGVPVGVLSASVIAHGATVIGVSTKNLIESKVNRTHDNVHGKPSSSGSKSRGNYKKTKKGSEANKTAKELGYKDAHDLKSEYVGKGNESKFNIEIDRTTGKVRLIDSKGTIVEVFETLK